jgi:hypothetical protein
MIQAQPYHLSKVNAKPALQNQWIRLQGDAPSRDSLYTAEQRAWHLNQGGCNHVNPLHFCPIVLCTAFRQATKLTDESPEYSKNKQANGSNKKRTPPILIFKT